MEIYRSLPPDESNDNAQFGTSGDRARASTGSISDLPELLSDAEKVLDIDPRSAKAKISQALEILGLKGAVKPQCSGGLAGWQAKRVMSYIDANLTSRIRTVDLAELVDLSASHFSHCFRQTFRETPLNYIAKKRVYMAQVRMKTSVESLSQIALVCGFCDQSHFTRVFHKYTGFSPRVWRGIYSRGPGIQQETIICETDEATV